MPLCRDNHDNATNSFRQYSPTIPGGNIPCYTGVGHGGFPTCMRQLSSHMEATTEFTVFEILCNTHTLFDPWGYI